MNRTFRFSVDRKKLTMLIFKDLEKLNLGKIIVIKPPGKKSITYFAKLDLAYIEEKKMDVL